MTYIYHFKINSIGINMSRDIFVELQKKFTLLILNFSRLKNKENRFILKNNMEIEKFY